ncbi:MAG TPA: uracil-DNA glycosylase [Candidatus Fimenecus excrementigallinarum]|uniref:Type-4 uracil-DNA glycosylase n=1 Tax=Candidatus Fimenecus excrementigallinarum TaxID=2840816 RepID=A0A9D1IE29_9FIRM|nr:uracil-DNA glycosylase [Candidatus Fimenecus excrementigallinarum]
MAETLSALRAECLACRKCGLCETRQNVVFGAGAQDAKILFVGEGPGEQEDKTGEPFVGRGGQLLDKYLYHVGLSRETNVYIANIVKCRPPQNRDPREEEQAACAPWLREQIRLLQPRVLVCLGRIAAQLLIRPDFRVTREHGRFYQKDGRWVMGTYHPAALLRNPAQKGDALADFCALREKLGDLGFRY